MTNKNVLPITLLIVGLVGGFGGGYLLKGYQQTQARANFAGGNGVARFAGAARGGAGEMMGRGGGVTGTILSIDDKSVTIKLQDDSSRIVILTDTTVINKSAQGSKSDLKVGEKVAVFGIENSDKSVTAQNIQLNPVTRGIFSESPKP